jgi:hypothetical protein
MSTARLSAVALALLVGFALAVPAAALPPTCFVNCSCTASCARGCSFGGKVLTCGAWGVCVGHCFAATDKAQSAEALRAAIFTQAPPVGAAPPVKAAPAK